MADFIELLHFLVSPLPEAVTVCTLPHGVSHHFNTAYAVRTPRFSGWGEGRGWVFGAVFIEFHFVSSLEAATTRTSFISDEWRSLILVDSVYIQLQAFRECGRSSDILYLEAPFVVKSFPPSYRGRSLPQITRIARNSTVNHRNHTVKYC